jgi:NADPH-dependent 2,4-dienoyl-CoA reductase/sulfur reductase-like enzyme
MKQVDHLVVVGASQAGLQAVQAARSSGFAGRITLIGEEPHPPYDRTSLAKGYLLGEHPAPVPLATESELVDELGVDLRLGQRAVSLDLSGRRVELEHGSVAFGSLVVATGAAPLGLPGDEGLSGVTRLRTLGDAAVVRAAMEAGARLAVVGAGFVGSDVASAARRRGLQVTVVEAHAVPLLHAVGSQMGELLAGLHRRAGTRLEVGVRVTRLLHDAGQVTGLRLADGRCVDADLVVTGVGVTPATGWLSGALDLYDDGGVRCDATLATSAPGVWAAGDVAHVPHPLVDGELLRTEHLLNAAEQGAIAGRNAVAPPGQLHEKLDSVPYFWADWYGHRIQFLGTPAADEVVLFGRPGPGAIGLYRSGERIIGALTVDRPRDIMKFRGRIARRGSWAEAVAHARGLPAPQLASC